MRRIRFRTIVSMMTSAALGVSTPFAMADEGRPRTTAPLSVAAVPTPPSIVPQKKAPASRVEADADVPDTATVDGRSVETIRERCSHGHVRLLRQVAQDTDGNYVNHGIWKRWDEEGNLIGIGEFRDGQRHGHWEQVIFANEVALLKQSPYREFPGPYLSEANFDRGRLHGKWTISDANDRKVSEIELSQGQRHGTSTWYFPNGARFQEIHYVDGQLEGDLIRWNIQGAEVSRKTFKQGREVIVKSDRHANGQVKSQTTMLSPTLVIETPDDWARTAFVKYQVSGEQVKQGLSVQFHPNGQKAMEGAFEANEPIGKHTWWHVNGQKSIEGTYRSGKPDGAWMWWHASGSKSTQGDYSEGTPAGEWIWWNPEGKVMQRASLGSATGSPSLAQPTPTVPAQEPQLAEPRPASEAFNPEPPVGTTSRRR